MKNTTNQPTSVLKGFFILLFLLSGKSTFCQNTPLFNYLSIPIQSLNAHQDSMLKIVKRDSFNEGYRLISINSISSAQDSGFLSINLPFLNCSNPVMQAVYVNYQSDSNFFWGGMNAADSSLFCERGYFTLTRYNGDYAGRLMIGDSFYHIQDLGGGILVLGKENSDIDSGWCGSNIGNMVITNRGNPEDCTIKVTKILMCFSDAAQKAVTNIQAELRDMVNSINMTLMNSKLDEAIELVGTVKFQGFVESFNITGDFNLFKSNTGINAVRDNLHADLCALVTTEYVKKNGTGITGISSLMNNGTSTNQGNKSAGYFICGIVRGNGKEKVAVHEAGHCYFGDHETSQGPSAASCAHAFEFKKGISKFRTAIHNQSKNEKNIILFYSNSDVKFKGKATGVAGSNSNFCRMDWYKEDVRAYYIEQGIFYAILQTSGKDSCSSVITLNGDPHCYAPPVSYFWNISYDGIHYQSYSTLKSTTLALPAPPLGYKYGVLHIKLNVKDNTNHWVYLYKSIRYDCK